MTRAQLGETLSAARAAKQLSTGDLALAMNVRQTIIHSMESGDFAACGGDVYARGHIRAYARQVDLDPEPLIARFKATTPAVAAAPGPTPARPLSARAGRPLASLPGPLDAGNRKFVPIAIGLGVVLVLALTVQGISSWRSGRSAEPLASQPQSSSSPRPSGSPSAVAATSPPSTAKKPPPASPRKPAAEIPAGSSDLRMQATKGSWVSVKTEAGATLFSGMLSSGQAKDFRSPGPLRVTLGNAGGVELTVNGKKIGPAGAVGQVLRLKIKPGEQLSL